ncbi:hypothetical protein CEXT_758711 [Caerostris extrusa]|uniref:Uncharacterized protein n=1 Tax=Caerostris extrusa TaxID=172846 RepID=A0AAV4X6F1_CAEEX|nr:hypothetical protein CEXT_758711 [Caerostris extrusa]
MQRQDEKKVAACEAMNTKRSRVRACGSEVKTAYPERKNRHSLLEEFPAKEDAPHGNPIRNVFENKNERERQSEDRLARSKELELPFQKNNSVRFQRESDTVKIELSA